MTIIAIIYDAGALQGDVASRDVLDQIEAIESALAVLGRQSVRVGVTLDLQAFKSSLFSVEPDVVFNLVESLDGSDRLQAVVAMLLEDWGVSFTGCGAAAMLLSNHKIESKRRLIAAGLPTADCVWLGASGGLVGLPENALVSGDWIIKTLESHASLFIDDGSVLRNAGEEELAERLRGDAEKYGQSFFAEKYVEGREFNVSVLENEAGLPEVLPVAEICFDALPRGKPRIVGYAAKWDEDSDEYVGTPRSFVLEESDGQLAGELAAVAKGVWGELGLSGYARVDFRVDGEGRLFVLEANSNPCLSLDAGFAAAAERAGLSFADLTARILRAARFKRLFLEVPFI